MTKEERFREASYWSPRHAARKLEEALPGLRNWESFLGNDRKRQNPRIPFEKIGDVWAVLYKQTDVEDFIERVRKDPVAALGRV